MTAVWSVPDVLGDEIVKDYLPRRRSDWKGRPRRVPGRLPSGAVEIERRGVFGAGGYLAVGLALREGFTPAADKERPAAIAALIEEANGDFLSP